MLRELLQLGLYGSGVVGIVEVIKALQVRIEAKERVGLELSPSEIAEKDFCTSFYRLMSMWGLENHARALKLKKDELGRMEAEFLREWDGIWGRDEVSK